MAGPAGVASVRRDGLSCDDLDFGLGHVVVTCAADRFKNGEECGDSSDLLILLIPGQLGEDIFLTAKNRAGTKKTYPPIRFAEIAPESLLLEK
jgi:hypothetical protein